MASNIKTVIQAQELFGQCEKLENTKKIAAGAVFATSILSLGACIAATIFISQGSPLEFTAIYTGGALLAVTVIALIYLGIANNKLEKKEKEIENIDYYAVLSELQTYDESDQIISHMNETNIRKVFEHLEFEDNESLVSFFAIRQPEVVKAYSTSLTLPAIAALLNVKRQTITERGNEQAFYNRIKNVRSEIKQQKEAERAAEAKRRAGMTEEELGYEDGYNVR